MRPWAHFTVPLPGGTGVLVNLDAEQIESHRCTNDVRDTVLAPTSWK